ncbi:cyclin-dependent kinase inhibitor 1 [Trichomycterus rosablanca]|uniref:cyclin-dependent kinase inhibitor 1 n=1 Tax=Trichomycterus rosablanca TaxID=2290929 RepID=UPI002F350BA3
MAESVLRCLCSSNGPTRRTLFGPLDRARLQQDYTLLMKKELQEASRRWNFDFASDEPLLDGDYEWTEISGARVPTLYREGTWGGAAPHLQGAKPNRRLEKENISETSGRGGSDSSGEGKRQPLKRKQTNITDFYQAKRRVVATTRKSGQ